MRVKLAILSTNWLMFLHGEEEFFKDLLQVPMSPTPAYDLP